MVDLLDLSYEEMEATFRSKRKVAMPKFWSTLINFKALTDPAYIDEDDRLYIGIFGNGSERDRLLGGEPC